jgi:pyrimidine-nucleoside phosphorylase
MQPVDLIRRKRDGGVLDRADIETFIAGVTDGSFADYQASALLMAIVLRGMTAQETAWLTDAMVRSGVRVDYPGIEGIPVDKHSTGGVGDKTSLILAPLAVACGAVVPMMSGRGLGHTGGTLDKLESIPGFRTGLSLDELRTAVRTIGCAMIGQTSEVAPADRKLYALRDVTGTVPSVPLITASIMSKKLAEGLDRLVLDVKWGRGAFMQMRPEAEALAHSLTAAGALGGVEVKALINPMNEPLGCSAGNALEVREVIAALHGRGPQDLVELTLDLACAVSATAREVHRHRMTDGTAWRRFQAMITAQGGDGDSLTEDSLPAAPVIKEILSPASGAVQQVDAAVIGQAVLQLGAGRTRASDAVDHAVGIDCICKTGAAVRTGDLLCRIHARSSTAAEEAAAAVLPGIHIA